MKKLILILLLLPIVGFGQDDCGSKPIYKGNKFGSYKISTEYKKYKKEYKTWEECNKIINSITEQELISYFDENRIDPIEGIWIWSVNGRNYCKMANKKSDNIYYGSWAHGGDC